MTVSPTDIRRQVATVRARIAEAGGDPDAITLVAVTKGFGPDLARAALAAGLADLGENYAQELLAKVADLESRPLPIEVPTRPAWHFLGRLQTNKVRHLAGHVALWQSVDRAELVLEIAKRDPGARVLIQLNLSDETQKGGCPVVDTPGLVAMARDSGLDVRGLMGVAPAGAPPLARPGFERLVALAEALDLPERSIGMSGDLEVAVAAGATMIRIGRDLFGERPPR